MEPVYRIGDILKLLPHRFPFLLVDRVDELHIPPGGGRIGRKIKATKNVTFNEPFFPGHFPHKPVMPGVLQIEAMAQCAALSIASHEGPKLDVLIAAVNDCRFRRVVEPGDTLTLEAEVMKERAGLLVIRCSAKVGSQLACEAEVIAKVFHLEGAPL